MLHSYYLINVMTRPSRQRERERERESETEADSTQTGTQTCPECSSDNIVTDADRGELVCQ
ncbi:MAG: transcription initiation factor TFIIIB, Brf1 subunit/Transcription initiation factor TFIIB, partial [halophilic archaeon J07HX5]